MGAKNVGAVALEFGRGGASPILANLGRFNHLACDRTQQGQGGNGQKMAGGLVEGNLQGERVESRGANGLQIGQRRAGAPINRFTPCNDVENRDIGGGDGGVAGALHGRDHIISDDLAHRLHLA